MKKQSALEKATEVLEHLPLSLKHLEAEINVLRASHEKLVQENQFLSLENDELYDNLNALREKFSHINIAVQMLSEDSKVLSDAIEHLEAI